MVDDNDMMGFLPQSMKFSFYIPKNLGQSQLIILTKADADRPSKITLV